MYEHPAKFGISVSLSLNASKQGKQTTEVKAKNANALDFVIFFMIVKFLCKVIENFCNLQN